MLAYKLILLLVLLENVFTPGPFSYAKNGVSSGSEQRRKLLNYMNLVEVDECQCEGEIGRLMLILEQACTNDRVGRELEKMWRR